MTHEGRTAVDVVAYAAHLACQMGAHIVKVKPPTDTIESEAARTALQEAGVPLHTLADRVRHVVQSAFDGHRIVIFSGGAAKGAAAVSRRTGRPPPVVGSAPSWDATPSSAPTATPSGS